MQQRSQEIEKLAAALAKAQGQMLAVAKDAVNTYFEKKYATLAAVWETIREPLSSNGLSVIQAVQHVAPVIDANGELAAREKVLLETTLLHESGQFITSSLPIYPVPDNKGVVTPQSIGSAVSYARRYSLMALVGVAAADEDDDGNGASGNNTETRAPQSSERSSAPQQPRATSNDEAQVSLALKNSLSKLNDVYDISRLETARSQASLFPSTYERDIFIKRIGIREKFLKTLQLIGIASKADLPLIQEDVPTANFTPAELAELTKAVSERTAALSQEHAANPL